MPSSSRSRIPMVSIERRKAIPDKADGRKAVPAKGDGRKNAGRALIRSLGLLPHPEGGYYREVHRSAETVRTDKGPRTAVTTIYFLLLRGQISVFHRVLSDEIWHHYQGAPLRLWRVAADFQSGEAFLLGPAGVTWPQGTESLSKLRGLGRARKAAPVAVIPRDEWQAAETLGDYTLVGCSVGPGFDFKDFLMLRDDAKAAKKMGETFPGLQRLI